MSPVVDDALEAMPPLYRPWVRAVLEGPVPRERRATCDECPMVRAEPPAVGFRADTRCCTFHPELPNFLVGAFFRELRPELLPGRRLLEAKIRARVGVTPLGIDRPPVYALTFRHGRAAFGSAQALRCPYYLEGERHSCGVWHAREATCATWFCKHERGRVGRAFWEALRHFLQAVDRDLARACVVELGLPSAQLAALAEAPAPGVGLEAGELDGRVDPARWDALWGEHKFGEHRFFAACHELVEGLGWEGVEARLGGDARLRRAVLRDAYGRLVDKAVPEAVEPAPVQLVKLGRKAAVVQGYSPFDLLELPRPLFDLLGELEGATPERALAVAEEAGVELDRRALRALVDFGLLRPVEG
ncbi:MAG TPA: hypothetical protein RMH85_14670 [Polyangiaceae bacterium LLY-WYZ-15_(1-7)]|nr:hypothetical protein [Myxococcales bacterium]HJL02743.1 hypothetical protein [Polyangiaceae bacterium LLY-WYZ-15_(1-7)]HJL09743.1 hypothetical protein [Polyangiaceae bacterium LLY-WYZ-15_(1-7)]HJL23875.1 hypothetical protein [Polyangiaceae bacterium LLY-WYZ-15_(1-7)]HJL39277.1 hypothetical protein [Polyangiaceae bacterium LLY-WYZ-15_(1-7)]